MGNVIGEPFKTYVDKQIKKRQAIHGKKTNRSLKEISYLNSTLAWVKLASGVSLTKERLKLLRQTYGNSIVQNTNPGKELAAKNVLFNGLTSMGSTNLSNYKDKEDKARANELFLSGSKATNKKEVYRYNQNQRTSFLGDNGAYGVGGTSFGIVPMPGIISVDSQDLNRGSIKKSRVKIKAYNKEQFDLIDVLYLRLGYTVLMEFGNSQFYDSGDLLTAGSQDLEQMGPTLIDTDFFETDDNYYELLTKIENNRKKYRGNYDAILGKISNFSWTFANDGTYDIDLDIISIGDVIESLKINIPPLSDTGDAISLANRQAVLSQLSQREANDQSEFFTIYPNLEKQLDLWYKGTEDMTAVNLEFMLPQAPRITKGSTRSTDFLNSSYQKGIAKGEKYMTNLGFNNKPQAYGTITVKNVPSPKSAGSSDVLNQANIGYHLKEAMTFSIIKAMNGYYGGAGFRNPWVGTFRPDTKAERQTLANLSYGGDLDLLDSNLNENYFVDGNPLWANADPQIKEAANQWNSTFHGNNYTSQIKGSNPTALDSMMDMGTQYPSSRNKIVGNSWRQHTATTFDYYRTGDGRDDSTVSFKNKIKTATFFSSSLNQDINGRGVRIAKDKSTQNWINWSDVSAYAVGSAELYSNWNPKEESINFYYKTTFVSDNEPVNNSQRSCFYRHMAMWILILGEFDQSRGKFSYKNIYAGGDNSYKKANKNLLKNISLDQFKKGVYLYFKLMNAAGGKDDNQFKPDPTFASFSQELEFEKNKDRIYSWLYRVNKYYTGITPASADLYQIKDLKGNLIKEQQPGKVFGPIHVNGDAVNESSKILIGKIINPYNVTGNDAFIEAWRSRVGYPSYKTFTGAVDFFCLDSFKNKGIEINLDGEGRFKFFIKFKVLLDFIQDEIIPSIVTSSSTKQKVPLLKIDTDTNANICYTIDNQLSTNIKTCIIRNDRFKCFKNAIAQPTLNKMFEGIDFFQGNSSNGNIFGRPMNIYLNFEFVKTTLDKVNIDGETVLFEFLKTICDSINTSLGNVNNLEPVLDHSTNTVKIIDQTPIPNLPDILSSLKDDNGNDAYPNFTPFNPAVLELYGYKNNTSNFVHSVGLTTTISKRYASMITIGATANGSIPGMEATAFSRWNEGVIDRIKPEIVDGSLINEAATLSAQNQEVIKRYVNYLSIGDDKERFKVLGLSGDGSFNDVYMKNNPGTVSDYFNYAQAESSKSGSLESSVGFLPFNLSIDLEGISGIKIYNRLHVDTRFLPSNYPQTLDFIVTKVNHSLQRNAWTTKLETQATKIIEDTKDKGQVNTNDILLSDDFKDVITNIETSKPVQSFSTPSKIIDTNTIFGYPANATYNQSITPDQAAAAVNPFLRAKFLPFFKGLLETGGYTYKITSCFRTLERSQNFRDQLGKVQPYAGRSNHNVGTAIDMVVIRDSDNKLFTKSTPFQIWQDQLPHLMELYQKLGLFWGGLIKGYNDPVHFGLKYNKKATIKNYDDYVKSLGGVGIGKNITTQKQAREIDLLLDKAGGGNGVLEPNGKKNGPNYQHVLKAVYDNVKIVP